MNTQLRRILLVAGVAFASLGIISGFFCFGGVTIAFSAAPTGPFEMIESEVKAIEEKLKEPIPSSELLIYRELDRSDGYVSRITSFRQNFKRENELPSEVEEKRTKALSALSTIASTACDAQGVKVVADNFRIVWDMLSFVYDLAVPRRWESSLTTPTLQTQLFTQKEKLLEVEDAPHCESIKKAFATEGVAKDIGAVFDTVKRRIEEEHLSLSSLDERLNKLLDIVTQRRAELIEKVRTPAQQITGQLWMIMVIIGVFSILAIASTALFNPTIQAEWVSSGQVIQFVTVMILLSVIMALGLSKILQENTLGTLLGGIAGYVLSQGVGRAAAQAVARAVVPPAPPAAASSTQASAPPSAPVSPPPASPPRT